MALRLQYLAGFPRFQIRRTENTRRCMVTVISVSARAGYARSMIARVPEDALVSLSKHPAFCMPATASIKDFSAVLGCQIHNRTM